MQDMSTTPLIAEDPVLEAAAAVFVRYGMRRATMGDIAKAAEVSRQTLYGRYENKNGIAAATMVYFTRRSLAQVEAAWRDHVDLGEKLDAYFDTVIISFFRLMQQSPDAKELEASDDVNLAAAAQDCAGMKAATLTRLFAAHGAGDAEALGRMVATAASGFKSSAQSEAELLDLLATLKMTVLSVFAAEK